MAALQLRILTRRFLIGAGMVSAGLMAVAIIYQPTAGAVRSPVNTLKISPLRSDIEVAPGTSKIVSITVTNVTNEPMTVRLIENDFISGDENGTPALILDDSAYAPTHSLKRFMAPLPDVSIPPKQATVIAVMITVPVDAQAGGYFGALRLAPALRDDSGQVNASASVASLILLRVPGDIVEKLTLTDSIVQQGGAVKSFFTDTRDIALSLRLKNSGNIQAGPFGKVSIKRGATIVQELDFNNRTPRDMILPDSARRWNVPLAEITKFGRYTVNATLTYGQDNQTIEVTQSFWVIPRSLSLLVLGGVALLSATVVVVLMYRRSYKARHYRRGHRGRRRR